MIPFFFTIPISRMMPMIATTLRSWPKQHQRQQRAHAGGRQSGENRDRMNEAFIQHAEHDVDRHQRGQNQQRLIRQRILERRRRALKIRLQAGRHVHVFLHLVDRGIALPSAAFGARLNETVTAGNCP